MKRWIAFYSVGALGITVQMSVLCVLSFGLGMDYLLATGLAVEAAVLHNFLWHQHWTWVDRPCGGSVLRRLVLFHLTNGVLPLAGNIMLMQLFVERLHFRYLIANALAIASCAVFTFFASDRFVFRPDIREAKMNTKRKDYRNPLRLLPVIVFCALNTLSVRAADLHPETLTAWVSCVDATERRIASELSSRNGFLLIDFQGPSESARERSSVLSGKVVIKPMDTTDAAGARIEVPNGMLHHWRGSIFVPGVTLDSVLSRVKNPGSEDTKQEDVLDSRVLETAPGSFRLYLKLQRSKIVTVRYNTEHLVQYLRYGSDKAASSSTATKIAELEHLGNGEIEKPLGHDHGYLWRMNSYWRYQQIKGGVIIECESMTLSRSIPSVLEFMLRPLINGVARESMERTLQSMRSRLLTTRDTRV